MTQEQWKALTPEEQRIKVAELMGWKLGNMFTGNSVTIWTATSPKGTTLAIPYTSREELSKDALPDYLNDLNAMHECMLLVRNLGLFTQYYGHLSDTLTDRRVDFSAWEEQNSSAEVRAEAFVLTMDKGDL